jgi:hypothetical protein
MTQTSVFLTIEEVEALQAALDALDAPAVALQCGSTQTVQQQAHAFALKHGLPEIRGYYGVDLRTRNVLAP